MDGWACGGGRRAYLDVVVPVCLHDCWSVVLVVCRDSGGLQERSRRGWKFEDGWSAKHVIFDVLAVRSGTSLHHRINDYTIMNYDM